MPKASLVSNTSPLLYLGRIGYLNLLPGLFETVLVPKQVALELDAGRLIRRDTIDPRSLDWIRLVAVPQSELDTLPENWLGLGEQAVIAYARKHRHATVALDDLQARLYARSLGLIVVGIVGILLRAKQANLVPAVHPLLDALHREGFYLHDAVHAEALRLAGEV